MVLDQRSQNAVWLHPVAETENPGFESEVGDTEVRTYIVIRIDRSRKNGIDYVANTPADVKTGEKIQAMLEWELRTLTVSKATRVGMLTKLELKEA